MPAVLPTLFSKSKNRVNSFDLASVALKIAMVTSAYTPDDSVTGHSLWSEVSANEVTSGNGYTTGGLALSSIASSAVVGGYKLSSATPVWTFAPGNSLPFRYYVMYVSGTLWGMTNPLVGYWLADATGADYPSVLAGTVLTVTAPVGGWFAFT